MAVYKRAGCNLTDSLYVDCTLFAIQNMYVDMGRCLQNLMRGMKAAQFKLTL